MLCHFTILIFHWLPVAPQIKSKLFPVAHKGQYILALTALPTLSSYITFQSQWPVLFSPFPPNGLGICCFHFLECSFSLPLTTWYLLIIDLILNILSTWRVLHQHLLCRRIPVILLELPIFSLHSYAMIYKYVYLCS